jgi:hypothetical protein
MIVNERNNMTDITLLKQQLDAIPVPVKTDSYQPVKHSQLIDTLHSVIGGSIESIDVSLNTKGTVLAGYANLSVTDSLLGKRIGFINSYDKSKKVGFAAGVRVMVCSNGMFIGDIKYVRKHTGSVVTDLEIQLQNTIYKLNDTLITCEKTMDAYSEIKIDKGLSARLAGELLFTENIISITQASVLKKEMLNSSYEDFKQDTLWSFYNHCTTALKSTHPKDLITKHIELDKYLETVYHQLY